MVEKLEKEEKEGRGEGIRKLDKLVGVCVEQ